MFLGSMQYLEHKGAAVQSHCCPDRTWTYLPAQWLKSSYLVRLWTDSTSFTRYRQRQRIHHLSIKRICNINNGNNKNTAFFYPNNYIYFLNKVRKFILPPCDILNYCLMPTHFHLLIHADQRTINSKKVGLPL